MILLVEGKVFLFFFFKFYKFLYRKIQTVHVFISVQILFCIRGLVITEGMQKKLGIAEEYMEFL